jgi:hypothetical protein
MTQETPRYQAAMQKMVDNLEREKQQLLEKLGEMEQGYEKSKKDADEYMNKCR